MKTEINGFYISKEGLKVSIQPGTMVLDSGTRNLETSWTLQDEREAQSQFNCMKRYAHTQPSAIGTNITVDKQRKP